MRAFVGVVLLMSAHRASADENASPRWSFGWDGTLIVGRWMSATVELTVTEAGRYAVEVAALDAVGHTARFASPEVELAPGPHRITGLFQLGRLEGDFTARVLKADQPVSVRSVRPGIDADVPVVMKLSDRLFVAIGTPRGMEALAHHDAEGQPARVVTSVHRDGKGLPAHVLGYDGVHAVVIAGDVRLGETESAALLEWVRNGGRLIVSVPKDVAGWHSNPLRAQLPINVTSEPFIVRELGSLEVFAGRNVRIPAPGRLAVARMEVRDGLVLAGTREEPLMASAPFGLGEVTVLALDLSQAPLANWGGLNDFMARLLNVSNSAANSPERRSQQVGQLTTTGISDLASQLVAVQDHFAGIRRASPWLAMGWLLVYIVIVGPLDYFLVHYVLRRPGWTWVSVLLSALGFGWVAAQTAQSASPATPMLKQLDVCDVDVAQQRIRHRSWTTHYAPQSGRVDWEFVPLVTAAGSASVPWLKPFAAPETSFGGMYRAPGSEWGRTDYRIQPAAGSAHDSPALERSTQQWLATWVESNVQVLESDLRADGLGRLTGTMTHHFPGPIHDWMLAFGNRVYRLQNDRDDAQSLEWKPEKQLSLEDPQMYQRELRGFLTGSVTRLERKDERLAGNVRQEQTRYNPLERDPLAVWQAITFHTQAGAGSYTTLANDLLHTDDLSRQLELGRAVVLGRVVAPSRIAIQRTGQIVTADELTVVVRLVIPVGRSTEIQRTLPKLDKIP